MPIRPFLHLNITFDPEAKRVMRVAYEMARIGLGLGDSSVIDEGSRDPASFGLGGVLAFGEHLTMARRCKGKGTRVWKSLRS